MTIFRSCALCNKRSLREVCVSCQREEFRDRNRAERRRKQIQERIEETLASCPERQERIQRYEARAALELPLFG